MISTSSRHHSPRVWLTGLLAILTLAVCGPAEDSDQSSWEFDEPPSDEADEPETPEPGPQIPETDPSRDCPEFQSSDPDEFDFELYRYLACRRAPDESLVFSPALVRIALAEAAQNAPSDQATHIAQLFGKEDLGEFVAYADNLREELLLRRPIPASTNQTQGRGSYEIAESDLDVLQQALGVEFYSASCSDDCQWLPQNQRWTENSFHALPPRPEPTLNDTRSIIVRAQSEVASEPGENRTRFTTSTDEAMWYSGHRAELKYWGITELGLVADWRPVGGQFAFLFLHPPPLADSPREYVPLESLEEALSHEHLSELLHETSSSGRTLAQRFPHFHIEESIDLGAISGIDNIHTTTAIDIGAKGINNPMPVELDYSWIEVESSARGGWGSLVVGWPTITPVIFIVYDRELEEILLLGRLARPF